MSVCICKVIKVAVQLRSKWKLIRNILNWFGVYSNSKPEFLLLVVKLDKCFMVKPFKSTHKGTPKFGQIFENFIFTSSINDSLYGDILLRKLITWKMSPPSAIQTFWRTSLYPFFQRNGDFRVIYDFVQNYYDNVTKYWFLCFWSFRSDKVQMFEHNRCSEFLYSWFSWISRRIIIYEAHDDILSEMYSWLPLPYSKIRATQNYKELYF